MFFSGKNKKVPRQNLGTYIKNAERTELSAHISEYSIKLNISYYQAFTCFVNITKYIGIYFVFTKSVRKFVRKFRGTIPTYISFFGAKVCRILDITK